MHLAHQWLSRATNGIVISEHIKDICSGHAPTTQYPTHVAILYATSNYELYELQVFKQGDHHLVYIIQSSMLVYL